MYSILRTAMAVVAPTRALWRLAIGRLAARNPGSPGLSEHYPLAQSGGHMRGAIRPVMPSRARVERRPLVRVVRVMESGQTPRQCGRLMISGRMADVCAELDRMVEREASTATAG